MTRGRGQGPKGIRRNLMTGIVVSTKNYDHASCFCVIIKGVKCRVPQQLTVLINERH